MQISLNFGDTNDFIIKWQYCFLTVKCNFYRPKPMRRLFMKTSSPTVDTKWFLPADVIWFIRVGRIYKRATKKPRRWDCNPIVHKLSNHLHKTVKSARYLSHRGLQTLVCVFYVFCIWVFAEVFVTCIVFMWSVFHYRFHFNCNWLYGLIKQTHLFFCIFSRICPFTSFFSR